MLHHNDFSNAEMVCVNAQAIYTERAPDQRYEQFYPNGQPHYRACAANFTRNQPNIFLKVRRNLKFKSILT